MKVRKIQKRRQGVVALGRIREPRKAAQAPPMTSARWGWLASARARSRATPAQTGPTPSKPWGGRVEVSQQNVELARLIREIRAGTSETEREEWRTPDSELWDQRPVSPRLPICLTSVGSTVERRPFEISCEWLAAWEIVEFEYELVDAGDRVVMLLEEQMRGRSGIKSVAWEVRRLRTQDG